MRLQAWQRWLLHSFAKPLVFLAALLPLAWLAWGAATDTLGANPAEALIRGLGDWALRLLWLTLAITPLRQALKLPALARFRRMLGLFAFAYASLHLLAYGWLDMGLSPAEIARDIAKRPFILMGFPPGCCCCRLPRPHSTPRSVRWARAAGRGCTASSIC